MLIWFKLLCIQNDLLMDQVQSVSSFVSEVILFSQSGIYFESTNAFSKLLLWAMTLFLEPFLPKHDQLLIWRCFFSGEESSN